MTPRTRIGLLICMSFLSLFTVLLVRTGSEAPPGDGAAFSLTERGLRASRPEAREFFRFEYTLPGPDRRATPLENAPETPKPTPRHGRPESSPDPKTRSQPTLPVGPSGGVYVIQKGDTLSSIARRFYKSDAPALIERLYQANKDRIGGKHRIVAGQELRIPGDT